MSADFGVAYQALPDVPGTGPTLNGCLAVIDINTIHVASGSHDSVIGVYMYWVCKINWEIFGKP